MKWFNYILIGFFLLSSCSSDNEEAPLITVNIEEGILGEWNVELECSNRTHIWEFYEDNTFAVNLLDIWRTGTYSLSDNNLTVNFIELGIVTVTYEYKIIVLTPDRLEIDDIGTFGVDYDFVRDCNLD
jgi:hypothetical protein